jgi:hypothetical protein
MNKTLVYRACPVSFFLGVKNELKY